MDPSAKRKSVIRELIGGPVEQMLDIGSGPVSKFYPYADLATSVLCVDHALKVIDGTPPNVETMSGMLSDVVATGRTFDAIICGDVFEHIPFEAELDFVTQCLKVLKDDGRLVVTVPHAGRYAWLDPYEVKPAVQRMLGWVGLYNKTFNGTCDVRKGHKHYSAEELAAAFLGFVPVETRYYGYVAEPLAATSLSLKKRGIPMPFKSRISAALAREQARDDYGTEAYSMGMLFRKS